MTNTLDAMLNDIESKILLKNRDELVKKNDKLLAKTDDEIYKIVTDVGRVLKNNGLGDFVRFYLETRIEYPSVKAAIKCTIKGFPSLQVNLIATHDNRGNTPLLLPHVDWELFIVKSGGEVQKRSIDSDNKYLEIVRIINEHLNE